MNKIIENLEYLGAIILVGIMMAGSVGFILMWIDVNFHLPV